jgi:hypothetical protein
MMQWFLTVIPLEKILWPWRDEDSSRYGRGIVQGWQWLSSWMVNAVAEQVPNIQRELTTSFRAKLPWEGGKCSGQYKGNLYCLARELVFWRCGRVSLLTTQVKHRRAWSAPGWVTVTRYICIVVEITYVYMCIDTQRVNPFELRKNCEI